MKRALYILLCSVLSLTAYAADEQDLMLIYRNDGDFNMFYTSEVDSITYVGEDVQVFWTADSIYRIPVEAIDSITFSKPETKLHSDVVTIDSTWLPYIASIDPMQLTFTPNITDKWTPTTGVILVYWYMDDFFPNGFAGRVSNITNTGSSIIVNCDSVTFRDVYETLIIYGEYDAVEDDPTNAARRAPQQLEGDTTMSGFIPFSHEFENGNMTSTVSAKVSYKLKVFVSWGWTIPFKMDFTFVNRQILELSTEVKTEVEETTLKPKKPLAELKIPITVAGAPSGFNAVIKVFPVLEYAFEGAFKASIKTDETRTISSSFYDSKWHPRPVNPQITVTPSLTASVKGNVGVGLELDLGLHSIADFVSTDLALTGTIGLKTESEMEFVQGGNIAYNVLKDAHIDTYVKGKVDLVWDLPLLVPPFYTKGSLNLYEDDAVLKEMYIFPTFRSPLLTITNNDKTVRAWSTAQRDLLFPVTLGFKMEHENEGLLYSNSLYMPRAYRGKKDTIDLTFDDCVREKCYSIYPLINLFGMEVTADPQTDVCLWYSVVGTWTCTGYSAEIKNRMTSMTCSGNGTMSQTYYNTESGTTRTYYGDKYTYDPKTKAFVMIKGNGDTQYWHVTSISDTNMTLTSDSNGFKYYFTRKN